MKPYMNPNNKGWFFSFWEDKVSKKIRRVFKKSARQEGKKIVKRDSE
jgi:hypothetical protein